jgi:hypothetical protein
VAEEKPDHQTDCLTKLESDWVVRQAKKAARTLAFGKYVRHQGRKELARRRKQMESR